MSPSQRAPFSYSPGGSGTYTSLPRSLPPCQPMSCYPAGSLTIPQRPHCAGADVDFQVPPLRRQLISRVSLDSPLSPSSRPRSPWGRFDPYDSPEVGFNTIFTTIQYKIYKAVLRRCNLFVPFHTLKSNFSPSVCFYSMFTHIQALVMFVFPLAGPRQGICRFCHIAQPGS